MVRQSLQGTQIIAYHRYFTATGSTPEQYVMVLLNFADNAASITCHFLKPVTQSVSVLSNYGRAFVWPG